MVFGAPAIMAFALFHGAGNGLLTIARGTLPLAIFGPLGYGVRNAISCRSVAFLSDARTSDRKSSLYLALLPARCASVGVR
jgi:hypothetical protein